MVHREIRIFSRSIERGGEKEVPRGRPRSANPRRTRSQKRGSTASAARMPERLQYTSFTCTTVYCSRCTLLVYCAYLLRLQKYTSFDLRSTQPGAARPGRSRRGARFRKGASRISRNLRCASSRSAQSLRSGWYWRASRRYAP